MMEYVQLVDSPSLRCTGLVTRRSCSTLPSLSYRTPLFKGRWQNLQKNKDKTNVNVNVSVQS